MQLCCKQTFDSLLNERLVGKIESTFLKVDKVGKIESKTFPYELIHIFLSDEIIYYFKF